MATRSLRLLVLCAVLFPSSVVTQLLGSELVVLTPDNRSEWVPEGKEVDAIEGDLVLRNDQLVAVIAQPAPWRNANMTVKNVGGMIIDLTCRERPSDQLSCYYATANRFNFHDAKRLRIEVDGKELAMADVGHVQGDVIRVQITSAANKQGVVCKLTYTLSDGADAIDIETIFTNRSNAEAQVLVRDAIRADRTFRDGVAPDLAMFWFYDPWFGQAYGVTCDGRTPVRAEGRGLQVDWQADGKAAIDLAVGESVKISRLLTPASDLLNVRGLASQRAGQTVSFATLTVSDPNGPVNRAKVTATLGDQVWAWGYTDVAGQVRWPAKQGEVTLEVEALGRPDASISTAIDGASSTKIELEACGYLAVNVTDGNGQAIPCKVGFYGVDGTDSPDFGPDSQAVVTGNIRYSHNGEFRQEVGPGTYEIVISRGPEFDAVVKKIEVERGETSMVSAKLPRVVDTRGWVSTEYHSHSTPSGDNTGSQLGRVLNLLAEHLEFAPCTEHNRIDSYVPHLERLDALHLLGTCTGMELTGGPLPVNHQNAFPLKMTPFTQDNGAPLTDVNPIVQIARLAMWDDGSEKLVQTNHPNLRQIYGDGNTDGTPDAGFRDMFSYMDVMEVHPPADIFRVPGEDLKPSERGNVMFNWMQLLNQGYRIPGVVNTDAHYNFHGSGWIRNYVASSTDDPAQIDVMEMVRNSERGKILMTTGPFMEVSAVSGKNEAMVGGDLVSENGKVALRVRVQCPNWLDVNRVQVFVNGRPVKQHDYRRRTHPEMFGNGVVKFEQEIDVALEADAHLIIATIGEGLSLGRVMGENWGKRAPVAVANPIFVDVDGGGFQSNGDELDRPLPVMAR